MGALWLHVHPGSAKETARTFDLPQPHRFRLQAQADPGNPELLFVLNVAPRRILNGIGNQQKHESPRKNEGQGSDVIHFPGLVVLLQDLLEVYGFRGLVKRGLHVRPDFAE